MDDLIANAITHVQDVGRDEIDFGAYDLAVFACGSEPRCVNIATIMSKGSSRAKKTIVLRISNAIDVSAEKNMEAFISLGYTEFVSVDAEDAKTLYGLLRREQDRILSASCDELEPMHLFVDYSSMPRDWYAALLNWACASAVRDIVIDFGYSLGKYESGWESKRCDVIRNIGDGGGVSNISRNDEGTVVIGLGLDEDAPYTIQRNLDLKKAIAFITSPSVTSDVEKNVKEINKKFLEEFCSSYPLMMFPIGAVAEVYQCLGEIAAVKHRTSTVVLAPLGPKPQILASILVMHKFKNTVCIKVEHKHDRKYEIEAKGEVVFTRVSIQS